MSIRKPATVAVILGSLIVVALAAANRLSAQTGNASSSRASHPQSLVDRLDNIGKNLFGSFRGEEPEEYQPAARPAAGQPTAPRASAVPPRSQPEHRAGSILDSPSRGAAGTVASPAPVRTQPAAGLGERSSASTASQPHSPPTFQRRLPPRESSPGNSVLFDNAELAEPEERPVASPPLVPREPSVATPLGRPLHERLSVLRDSAFHTTPPSAAASQAVADDTETAGSAEAYAADEPVTGPSPAGPVRIGPNAPPSPTAGIPTRAVESPIRPVEVPETGQAARPVIGPTPAPWSGTYGASRADDAAETVPTADARGSILRPGAAYGDFPVSSGGASSAPSGAASAGVLMVRKGPVLGVETTGPRKILVGRESSYEILIHNTGEVSADELVVHVTLPPWADVQGAEASTGATQVGGTSDAPGAFVWKIGQLAAGGRERLALRIVPRESRPFDLAIRWDYRPIASQAMIEVQEPRLEMKLEGPREVYFGRREVFALKLANTGTGDAENVVITLSPIGVGDNQPASHPLGTLPAGAERAIEVELTARQTGDLTIQVAARGDGGARAELVEKVLVRRAALVADVRGPQVQYVGTVAAYAVRVSNPGNAPAGNVTLSAVLPAGARYLSGIEGGRLDADGTRVRWTLDRLDAGAERAFEVRCNLGQPGANRLEVLVSADDDLSATAAATTAVEAVADLKLDVKDPAGPVPVGQEAVYEVRVRNRGTKTAEGVEVTAFFSQGAEPIGAEGGLYRIAPGQVAFSPIASIAPGEEIVLRIRAKAETAGNHVFRAEVHCRPLGTRLLSENTTRYYSDVPASQADSRFGPAPANLPQPAGATLRR